MQLMRAKKSLKTYEKKLPVLENRKMDREEVILEIKRLAEENVIPILIFPNNIGEMKILLEDMKLGSEIRYGLKQLNISFEKDKLQ